MSLRGKYIIAKIGSRTICSGKIINTKSNCNEINGLSLVSIDNKHYINLNCEKINYQSISDVYVENKLDIEGIEITHWRNYRSNPNSIIFRENDINELDEEVISLVNAINNCLGMFTVSSCCGHEVHPFYITIAFHQFNALINFSRLFSCNGLFCNDWVLTTSHFDTQPDDDYSAIRLRLICKYRGNAAYECAERLACYLGTLGD